MHPGLSVSHDSVFHSPNSGSDMELDAAESSSSLSISQPYVDQRLQVRKILILYSFSWFVFELVMFIYMNSNHFNFLFELLFLIRIIIIIIKEQLDRHNAVLQLLTCTKISVENMGLKYSKNGKHKPDRVVGTEVIPIIWESQIQRQRMKDKNRKLNRRRNSIRL